MLVSVLPINTPTNQQLVAWNCHIWIHIELVIGVGTLASIVGVLKWNNFSLFTIDYLFWCFVGGTFKTKKIHPTKVLNLTHRKVDGSCARPIVSWEGVLMGNQYFPLLLIWKELFFILLIRDKISLFSEFFNNVQWYSLGGCHLNISRKKQTCTRKDLVCIYMGQVSGWLLGFYINAIDLLAICQLISWDSLYVVCNLPNVCIQLTCFMMSNDFLRGCVGYDILIYSEEANIGREDSL